MKLKTIKITLCQRCLDGEDGECSVPECALCRHDSVGFPIMPELYEVIKEWENEELN